MTKEQIESIIFGERALVFGIFDGASIPELPQQIHKMGPPSVCIFRGDLEPDIASVAPYLVNLQPGSAFTNWVLDEGFGKHRGIFLHTRRSMLEMRKHFRGLVTVFNEEGNPMIFRYYDPRVLTKYLPTCNTEELASFFGDVDQLFAELPENDQLVSYKLAGGALKTNPIDARQDN